MLCTQSRSPGSNKPPELFVAEYCRLIEYFRSSLQLLLKLHLEVLLRVLTWLHRSYEVLMPRILFLTWCAIEKSHSRWSSPRALG
jgi:hypothetical protein